jgi:hypothetical protein
VQPVGLCRASHEYHVSRCKGASTAQQVVALVTLKEEQICASSGSLSSHLATRRQCWGSALGSARHRYGRILSRACGVIVHKTEVVG